MGTQQAQEEFIGGNIRLSFNGVDMNLELTVPATPVDPRRMLPVFQGIANSMVAEAIKGVESQGKSISCKPHCGACCSQAVPVSEAEVYRLAELVEKMPEPRRSEVKERFARAADHFDKIGWYRRFEDFVAAIRSKGSDAESECVDLILEYFEQGIPCPFLEDQSCSIYADRPVSCREYLVTSPVENCARPKPNEIDTVNLPIKPSRSVNMIVRTANLGNSPYAILSQALDFAATHPERFPQKTGPEWMRDFFEDVSRRN